jgi:hypothetical protein
LTLAVGDASAYEGRAVEATQPPFGIAHTGKDPALIVELRIDAAGVKGEIAETLP